MKPSHRASFQLMPGSLASHVTAWSLRFPCSPASHFPSSPALLCCQQTVLQARRPSCAGPQLGDPAAGEGRRGEERALRPGSAAGTLSPLGAPPCARLLPEMSPSSAAPPAVNEASVAPLCCQADLEADETVNCWWKRRAALCSAKQVPGGFSQGLVNLQERSGRALPRLL